MSEITAARRRGLLLALVATLLWSLAGVFSRLVAHLDFGSVLCGRAAFGGALGLLVAAREWRRGELDPQALVTPMALLVVLCSAASISAYIAALMTTTVADVMVIYATLPFLAAGLAFVINGERSARRTLIAAGVALVGVAIMVAGGLGHGRLLGQAFSLLMTATFALLVVLQRRSPKLPVTPINALAALVAAGFGYAMARPVAVTASDIVVLFLFGLTTITLAFAMFMEAAKHVPPAEASLIAMLDAGLGPLWVLVAFGEHPDPTTYIGGGLVLAAAVWRLWPELKAARISV